MGVPHRQTAHPALRASRWGSCESCVFARECELGVCVSVCLGVGRTECNCISVVRIGAAPQALRRNPNLAVHFFSNSFSTCSAFFHTRCSLL